MKTPIVDFVKQYIAGNPVRCHMPGHKGVSLLGCEAMDITEFAGADSLYDANGIIAASEQNASLLFGCKTLYSTEGSSHGIRAMLYLLLLYANSEHKSVRILAGRNAHKVFLTAAALLDIEVDWLIGDRSYLSCRIDPADLEQAIVQHAPTAVYITSPDYLGQTADIAAIAAVCRRHGVLLLVDNAHGAYLKFTQPSRHPMDLGADMCCDSAHKTLPALTGGAYLHIAANAPSLFAEQAKTALAMFGSTSPSYLILQSLDLVNRYLDDGYRDHLGRFTEEIDALKTALTQAGYTLIGDEPLKITVAAKAYGYRGDALAAWLQERGIVCEFFDPDFTVLMLTPENGDLSRLHETLLSIPRCAPLTDTPPLPCIGKRAMSAHDALLCDSETIDAADAAGRVLAAATVGCPPAVPIVMCGEEIDDNAVASFAYYGIRQCRVIKT